MKDFHFRIMGNTPSHSKSEDQRRLDEAVKSFGYKKVRALNGKWELRPGMRSTLFNHQLVGVSWMLRQEFSPHGPYGGILADQMGLGKTVQVLACMSANRPSPEDIEAGRHQTLIVAPAIAIAQWEREITKHCDTSFIKWTHHYQKSQNLNPESWKTAAVM
jgi:SNF2 family DNA or RNA helicase